jgi:hypothetical protein
MLYMYTIHMCTHVPGQEVCGACARARFPGVDRCCLGAAVQAQAEAAAAAAAAAAEAAAAAGGEAEAEEAQE